MVEFKNPILPGFHPDPSVCRVGDTFYLVNSTFAYFPGVPIYKSRDLVHWKQIGNVLSRKENLPLGTCAHSNGIYAPTLRFHDGTFYLITTNIENGGNFIVTAADPAGPWSDPHWLPEAEGIDPSLFFDDDGKCYYCGTKGAPNERFFGDNVIYLRELDLENWCFTGEETIVWGGALKDCEWAEGPHIYKINGMYYCMNAEGGTGPDHAITICRSEHLRGPYTGCKRNPVMTHRHLGKSAAVTCVGHADLVDDTDGNWYSVMLAMRPFDGCSNLGRETFLAKVSFEDGWPVFNPGIGTLLPADTLPLAPDEEQMPTKRYTFAEKKLPPEFVMLRNPDENMFRFPEDSEGIFLRTLSASITEKASPAYLGIRETSMNGELSTLLSFTPAEGEEAGLAVVQSDEANLRFVLRKHDGNTVLSVIKTEHGTSETVAELPYGTSEVTLTMRQELQKMRFSYSENGTAFTELSETVDTRFLSTEWAGGFVGNTLGITASSNGRQSENEALFRMVSYLVK